MHLDLEKAYADGIRAFDKPRGDELEAHVSDFGKCKYDVWSRRNGLPRIRRSVKTAARLQKGLHDEEYVVARIEAGLPESEGWRVDRGRIVTNEVTGHIDVVLERAECPSCPDWMDIAPAAYPHAWWCDTCKAERPAIVERALIDVKTTEWRQVSEDIPGEYTRKGTPKTRRAFVPYGEDVSTPHLLQAAGYSLELPLNPDGKHMPVAIAQVCRRSNGFKQFGWFFPDEPWLAGMVAEQREIVLRATAPGTDPIAEGIAVLDANGFKVGLPPEKYSCTYCDNLLCSLNTNPDNMEIPT